MKRGKGLERRTGLRANPEKTREFVQRGRVQLERSWIQGSKISGMRRASAAEGPLSPAAWREQAFVASGGRCVISGTRARNADDHRFDAHHILAKRELRARRLFGYVWDVRNALWILGSVHAGHEHPGVRDTRIPAEKLPPSVWEFCAELDELAGVQWATSYVLRAHPRRGGPAAVSH